jgi:hypothetical protein
VALEKLPYLGLLGKEVHKIGDFFLTYEAEVVAIRKAWLLTVATLIELRVANH